MHMYVYIYYESTWLQNNNITIAENFDSTNKEESTDQL